jgi:predicted RNase H-like nuclease (RuvC/YqgF family)
MAGRSEEVMVTEAPTQWDGAIVRTWLEKRIAAARADQVAAERGGERDDCDKAAAEEMVCTVLQRQNAAGSQSVFADAIKRLLDRDDHVWRGVYDDRRFDRHVRAYLRKLLKMAKDNAGFRQTRRYQ